MNMVTVLKFDVSN